MKPYSTLLLSIALGCILYGACRTQHHALSECFNANSSKHLTDWLQAWKNNSQKLTGSPRTRSDSLLSDCYKAFIIPGNSAAYRNAIEHQKGLKNPIAKQTYWIVQKVLPFVIVSDQIKLPDTTRISRPVILEHYKILTGAYGMDTARDGNFLTGLPDQWLIPDSVHTTELNYFLSVPDDSTIEKKIAFLQPYLYISQISRTTPLHSRGSNVFSSQPEIFLLAIDSESSVAQLFFMIGDSQIGFAVMKRQAGTWSVIFSAVDYWDKSE